VGIWVKVHGMFFFKNFHLQTLVAHAYNPSYSGGRDQKDFVLKPALANSI
jgi:hypothetical protein